MISLRLAALPVLALAIPLTACDEAPKRAEVADWLRPTPDTRPFCREEAKRVPQRARGTPTPVQVVLGKSVDKKAASTVLRKMATLYERIGVTFAPVRDAAQIEDGALILDAPKGIESSIRARRAMERLRKLMKSFDDPSVMRIVLVKEVVQPGADLAAMLVELDGLAFATGAAIDPALAAALDTGPVYKGPPIALVRVPARTEDALSHEIGHAMGFGHVDDDDTDVMSITRKPGCRPAPPTRTAEAGTKPAAAEAAATDGGAAP